MRPASERQGAAKTKATRRDADIALIERRIIELEDALSTARRERDESDAAWSEWVSSAESFANEMWSERDALRRGQAALKRSLANAIEEAKVANQREGTERTRREGLAAEIVALKRSLTQRATTPPDVTARLTRLTDEASGLRRQLADGMQKLRVTEAARTDAERAAEKLRIALDVAEAHAQRIDADLSAEREQSSRGAAPADRDELRKLRERIGAEQKRAIALSVELSALKRESEQRIKTARTEGSAALEALRQRLESEVRAARDEAARAGQSASAAARERDAVIARAASLEAQLESIAQTLLERETTLSEEAARADEATHRANSLSEEFDAWRSRSDEESAERERESDARETEMRRAHAAALDAVRIERDAARTAQRELEARLESGRAAHEAARREHVQARTAWANETRATADASASVLARERAEAAAKLDAATAQFADELARREREANESRDARVESERALVRSEAERDEWQARVETAAIELASQRAQIERESRRADAHRAERDAIEQTSRAEFEAAERARDEREQALRAESDRRASEYETRLRDAAAARDATERTLADAVARSASLEGELEGARRSREEIVRSLEQGLQQADSARGDAARSAERIAALEREVAATQQRAKQETASLRAVAETEQKKADEARKGFEKAIAAHDETLATARRELTDARRATDAASAKVREVEESARAQVATVRADLQRAASEANTTHAKALAAVEASRTAALDEARALGVKLSTLQTSLEGANDALARERDERTRLAALLERTMAERDDDRRSLAESRARDDSFAQSEAASLAAVKQAHQDALSALATAQDAHAREVQALHEARARADENARTTIADAESRALAVRKEREVIASQLARAHTERAGLQRQIDTLRNEKSASEQTLRDETRRASEDGARALDEMRVALDAVRSDLARQIEAAAERERTLLADRAAGETALAGREQLEAALASAERSLAEERAAAADLARGGAEHDVEIARIRRALVEVEADLADERGRGASAERAAREGRAALEAELASVREDASAMAATLRAAQERIDELVEHAEVREAVATAMREERDRAEERLARENDSLAQARRGVEDIERELHDARARTQELEQRIGEVQREAEARVELMRAQSNAAMRTLRSRVDGDGEKARKRFEELSTWLSDAEKRSGDVMAEAEHQRRLREKAERALAGAEHTVRQLTSRLEVERAQTEELNEQVVLERKKWEELEAAATRVSSPGRTSRPDTSDLRGEVERLRSERDRVERDLGEQLADLSTGLMARDAAIANLRQQLARAEREARKKAASANGEADRTAPDAKPSREILERLATLERERDAARLEFHRRVQDIERGFTERLIALAKADGSQVMFALSERVVALQNAAPRAEGDASVRVLEEEIEALKSENDFLLAEIERNARARGAG